MYHSVNDLQYSTYLYCNIHEKIFPYTKLDIPFFIYSYSYIHELEYVSCLNDMNESEFSPEKERAKTLNE